MSGIFISHAADDDDFVADLRKRLEALGLAVWVDSRQLRGGDRLAPEIEAAIADAQQVLVVLSPATVNSPWVVREIRAALQVQRERGDDYRVIPLLRPGITVQALRMWFPEDLLAVTVGPDGLYAAMPELLAALGERLPTDREEFTTPEAGLVEELILRLSGPRMLTQDGTRRAWATAQLIHEPARPERRAVDSRPFGCTAPLGPIEADDLRWYLDSYYLWPVGVFRDRAAGIEARLPQWGQALLTGVRGDGKAFEAWERAGRDGTVRRFSVLVDDSPPVDIGPEGQTAAEAQAAAREAATELLALPWELLHDGRTWLFQGKNAVRVRRRLPNRVDLDDHRSGLPIRILLISPRPERTRGGDPVGYIDHRVSARPLVEAVENLGELARLTVLQPPTYAALEYALGKGDQGQPFDVVHFDGHGVYDRKLGLGGLCFEQPPDHSQDESTSRDHRVLDFVDATRLAGLVRQHRIPLMFLEACQTALAETDPTASVAARLLDEGVASVVAMTHNVLVETSRRFVQAFYRELATGARVGTAMLAGQRALYADPRRGKILGAGELRLQDWFVPVLYQERLDPQPITRLAPPTVQRLAQQSRTLQLGELPAPPEHHFQGRSRELLSLERHLHHAQWAVVRGTGGQGKTTLAVELARWLVRTHRAQRAVFVNLEHDRDPHAVLDAIGRQLVPNYTVAPHPTLDQARLPVDRALADQPVILVIDNCESVLPDRSLTDHTPKTGVPGNSDDTPADGASDTSAAIFSLCRTLLDADPGTRLVFTTREPLPSPFAHRDHEWELGALHRDDAVELVGQVMKQHGWTPPRTDTGSTPEEITALVEAVHGHPRALVLLARETAERGVRATTADLRTLMEDLDRAHPGDRENSLYASVALSLRRLTPDTRRHVAALACCHGGVHQGVIRLLTGLDAYGARQLGMQLIGVGLGEDMGGGHLRLDPGLAPYLLGKLTPADSDALRARWADAMTQLIQYLYGGRSQDAQHAQRLVLLELPNLLALLDWLPGHQPPEQVAKLAAQVEGLLKDLGQPRALAHAVRIREQAAAQLTSWSQARHAAAAAEIDRLLQRGELPAALTAAQRLLDQHLAVDEAAYPGEDYDTAFTYLLLGGVLNTGGAAEAALGPLAEAERRFRQLADAGQREAATAVAKVRSEIGDCLRDLGRFDEAEDAYQESIDRATRSGDRRQAAVANAQLASLRLEQGRYQEALDGYAQVRATFEVLGEPRSVATIWHQTGRAHEGARQFDAAEDAYRQALAIKVRETDLSGQAADLNQLGVIYAKQGRLEESVTFLRQAAEISVRTGDRAKEGLRRTNLAQTLLDLRRYDEARQELQRAIVCKEDYGHAAETWRTWAILEEVERATGQPDAARAARQQAIAAYLSYRRDGGSSQSPLIQIYAAAAQAIGNNQRAELTRELNEFLGPDSPPRLAVPIRALQTILAGQRDPDLADDPAIHPIEAAELLLLRDRLVNPVVDR